MARATRHSGASYTEHELSDPQPPEVIIRRAELGIVDRPPEKEVAKSPGNSSSASTGNDQSSNELSTQGPQQLAPMTENLSSQQEKETDSTARSTATAGRKTPNRASSSAKARATAIPLEDEFDDFQ